MKKYCLLAALLFAPLPALATTTLLDGFEDTNYTTNPSNPSDSFALASSTDATEGSSSLEVTYTFVDEGQWFKSSSVTKTFSSPVDLSEMEFFKFDFNLATADPNFIYTIQVIDSEGIASRFVDWTGFTVATSGWETRSYKLSDLQKSEWVTNGRAPNLKSIEKVSIFLNNEYGASGDSSITFKLDNMRFDSERGFLNEDVIEDFESYASDTDLQNAWQTMFQSPNTSLDTADPYAGSQSMNLSADISAANFNYGFRYDFAEPQDFSSAKYFKIAMKGDSALETFNPTAHLYLVDSAGNRAISYLWSWPDNDEWTEIYLPFDQGGILPFVNDQWDYSDYGGNGDSCWLEDRWDDNLNWDATTDLADITSMILAYETQGAGDPAPSTVVFDDITVGYPTSNDTGASEPSDKSYTVNLITGSAPTIDGTLSSGEWDEASDPGCSGFVHHDDPGTAATEDPTVKALFDETNLYVLTQVTTSVFNQDFSPNSAGDDTDSTGDKFPFFLAPAGNMGDAFYRFSFVPDPGTSNCYIWDEAALTSSYPGVASWDADNDTAAFSYDSGSGLLTIEYSIPWTDFDLSGNTITEAPADGDVWGIQIGYTNDDLSEFVNWEPDSTPGYVMGRPFGSWTFNDPAVTSVGQWNMYH